MPEPSNPTAEERAKHILSEAMAQPSIDKDSWFLAVDLEEKVAAEIHAAVAANEKRWLDRCEHIIHTGIAQHPALLAVWQAAVERERERCARVEGALERVLDQQVHRVTNQGDCDSDCPQCADAAVLRRALEPPDAVGADAWDAMDDSKPIETERIKAQCASYWNEHNIPDAEVHKVLECIYRDACAASERILRAAGEGGE